MKTIVKSIVLFSVFSVFSVKYANAQIEEPEITDTTLANQYKKKAEICVEKARYDSALVYYRLAEPVYEKNKLWKKYINVLHRMAWIKAEVFKQTEPGMNLCQKALDTAKKYLDKKSIEFADIYYTIAVVYMNKSYEEEKALEYLFKSLSIKRKVYGEKSKYVAKLYNTIGSCMECKNDKTNALRYYKKALSTAEQIQWNDSVFIAYVNANLGRLSVYQQRGREALDYLMKALAFFQHTFDEYSYQHAVVHEYLGYTYTLMKDHETALRYYHKYFSIASEIYPPKGMAMVLAYSAMSVGYENVKNYKEALKYRQRTICAQVYDFNDSLNVYSNPTTAIIDKNLNPFSTLVSKGLLLEEMYNTSKDFAELELAYQTYLLADSAMDLFSTNVNWINDEVWRYDKHIKLYNYGMRICLKLSEKTSDKNKQIFYKKRFLYFYEKGRSAALHHSLSAAEALNKIPIDDTLRKLEKLYRDSIAFYRIRQWQIEGKARDYYSDRLFYFVRNYENLIDSIKNQYPQFKLLNKTRKIVSLDRIQSKLDNRTAIRCYQSIDTVLYMITITKRDFIIEHTKINKQRKHFFYFNDIIDNQDTTVYYSNKIEAFRLALVSDIDNATNSHIEKAGELYTFLFPNDLPNGIKQLIIIPDEITAQIPFEALVHSSHSNKENYLICKYDISYSYSISSWFRTVSRKQKHTRKELNLLAIAPVFTTRNVSVANPDNLRVLRAIDTLQNRFGILTDGMITPLPATGNEVKEIEQLFKNKNLETTVLLKENATEHNVKKHYAKSYQIVHFATHGFSNTIQPGCSGIVLSQNDTDKNDGFLFAEEIKNMPLHADLAVLSACETGLGKKSASEVVMGLPNSFLSAGVNNLIVSLWQVSDYSSSFLMKTFYKELTKRNRISYSKALQKAKIEMIKHKTYSHPFYWASFILIGQ